MFTTLDQLITDCQRDIAGWNREHRSSYGCTRRRTAPAAGISSLPSKVGPSRRSVRQIRTVRAENGKEGGEDAVRLEIFSDYV